MRTTFQSFCFKSRSTRRSRRRFPLSLGSQYTEFNLGGRQCSGHLCQKQPSTNTTTLSDGKVKSGLPGSDVCRFHPTIFLRRKIRNRRSSVRSLSRLLMRDIVLCRRAGVRICVISQLLKVIFGAELIERIL